MKAQKALASILSVTLFLLPLVSCAPAKGDPLAYQDRAASVSGTLVTDTGTFSAEVALPPAGGEARRDCTVTLTSPETVSGITVRILGGNVTVTSGSVTLPVSEAAAGRWLRFLGLFSVCGDVNSWVEDKGGGGKTVTVGVGTSPDRVFISFAEGSETPSLLRTEDGELSFSVSDYTFTDQTTEGTDTT